MRKLAILLLLALIISCAQQAKTTPQEPEAPEPEPYYAQLVELSGDVLVNGQSARLEMSLSQGDVVETKTGQAAVEFFEGGITRLGEQTTVTLSEISADPKRVMIEQENGETWNRLLKVAGISTYEVATPNTIATVRGTGFEVVVGEEETEIGVENGTVEVAQLQDGKVFEKVQVRKEQQVRIARRKAAQRLVVEKLKRREFLRKNLEKDRPYIERKNKRYVERYFKERGITKDQIENYVRDRPELIEKFERLEIPHRTVEEHLEEKGLPRAKVRELTSKAKARRFIKENPEILTQHTTEEVRAQFREHDLTERQLREKLASHLTEEQKQALREETKIREMTLETRDTKIVRTDSTATKPTYEQLMKEHPEIILYLKKQGYTELQIRRRLEAMTPAEFETLKQRLLAQRDSTTLAR